MTLNENRKMVMSALAAGISLLPFSVWADTEDPKLSVELNRIQTQATACELTFVVRNTTAQDIERLVLETVVFSATGDVQLLTLFDFQEAPAGTPRVRQFVVPGNSCDGIGSLLFNGVQACDGAPEGSCAGSLRPSSRTDIEVLG